MARQSAGRSKPSKDSGRAASPAKKPAKQAAYEDDELIIEEEPAPKASAKKSPSARSPERASTRASSSSAKAAPNKTSSAKTSSAKPSPKNSSARKGSSSKRSESHDEGGGKRRSRGAPPPKKKDDTVVWVLTGSSIAILLTFMIIIFMRSGGTEIRDDRAIIDKIKKQMSVLKDKERKWNEAERNSNEDNRRRYIVETRDAGEVVQKLFEELRQIKEYSKDGQFWNEGYEFLEKDEQAAGEVLHDVSKRAHTSDFQ